MDGKAAWRERTRLWAITELGGCCSECGSVENLQFDHRVAANKVIEISAAIRDGWSRTRIAEELRKCQLLCGPCHRAKSARCGETPGGQNRITNPDHGTSARYAMGCKCTDCRSWKRLYRQGLVDARGNPASVV